MLFGYLDPGTGSVIIQAVIGLAVGLGVFVKTYWAKIRTFFSGKTEKTNDDLRNDKTKGDA